MERDRSAMGDDSILSAILILFLLLSAGYFAVCETAFASVSRPRLRAAMDRGDRRAKNAEALADAGSVPV